MPKLNISLIEPEVAADVARKCGADQILVLVSKPEENKRTTTIVVWNNNYEDDEFIQKLKAKVAEAYIELTR